MSDISGPRCDICHEPTYACRRREDRCVVCGGDLDGMLDVCWDRSLDEMN